jgi:hypothetical protein
MWSNFQKIVLQQDLYALYFGKKGVSLNIWLKKNISSIGFTDVSSV